VRYVPTTAPGARLPSILLADGSALFDRLGPWFTLITFGAAPDAELVEAARRLGMPLEVVRIDQPGLENVYRCPQLLVRARSACCLARPERGCRIQLDHRSLPWHARILRSAALGRLQVTELDCPAGSPQ
jgi:hypothetical protein